MRRDSALVRQWVLLRTLSGRRDGVGVQALAQELHANEKTVRRDLEAFQAAGFPLRETVEAFGRKKWRLDPDKTQPALGFAFDEAIALYLGRRLLDPLAGTVFGEAAQRAFSKIRTMLSPGALRYLDKFAPIFHQTKLGVGDYSKKAELLDQLVMAMEERRITHITYQSLQATEPVTYDIYPFGLIQHGQSLYLVGWAPRREHERTWKIDRIEEVEVTLLKFEQPESFDLRKYLSKSFGIFHGDGEFHVKVRFSPTVSRYVQERRWHASQRLTRQGDGSLVAEFDLSTWKEISRWILGFGKEAEVLEPEDFRKELAAEVKAMHTCYSQPRSPSRPPRAPRLREELP